MFERFGEMGSYEELNELAGNFLSFATRLQPQTGSLTWNQKSWM